MSIVGKIVKVVLVTVASVVIWFYVVSRYVSFEIRYEYVPVTLGQHQKTGQLLGKKSRAFYQKKSFIDEHREISELEFLRSELQIQTENVARLAKINVDANRFSALNDQVRSTRDQLSKVQSENKIITTELTSIRNGMKDLQEVSMGAVDGLEQFMSDNIDHYIAHYGIEQFRQSILYLTEDLKQHVEHTTGGNLLISDKRVTYRKAQSMCEELGTFLVTIENREKLEQVREHVSRLKRWDIWIGLNRLNEKDDYLWDNKAAITFTNWDSGQPNRRDPYGKYGEEKCVIMWSTGKWHDYRCEVVAYFVCEKPIHHRKDIIKQKVLKVYPTAEPSKSNEKDAENDGSTVGRDIKQPEENEENLNDDDEDEDYDEDDDEDYDDEDYDDEDYDDDDDYEYYDDDENI